jgi:hypothetical protein
VLDLAEARLTRRQTTDAQASGVGKWRREAREWRRENASFVGGAKKDVNLLNTARTVVIASISAACDVCHC